jgi:regulator of replication initiation timing
MSTKHNAKFKAQVAIEALNLSEGDLEEFAKVKGVSTDQVLDWVSQLKENSATIFEEGQDAHSGHHHASGENVNLETEDELLIAAVSHGVNDDNLNYNKLFFWTTFGTGLVIVIIYGLIQFAQASWFDAQNEAAVNSQYSEIKELKAKHAETLNSYGVVDLENGTYRIPIDQAINKIAEN